MQEQQVKKLVDAMNEQGASQEEIQRAISSMSSSKGISGGSSDNPGVFKSLVQDVAEPFLKIPTTIAAGGARAIAGIVGGSDAAARAQQIGIDGLDYGFFGNVKPIGAGAIEEYNAGDISGGTLTKRVGLEALGTFGEIASYGIAPLKVAKGAGFFQTAFKAGRKFSAAFGASKGLQAAGEGKGGAEALLEGSAAALGSAVGYGLTRKAASLIGNWGARALQSEAVRVAGNGIKNLAEKVWTALPEAFQKAGSEAIDTIVNSSTRRTLNALKYEYGQSHKTAVNAWIDDTIPNIDRPDLSLGKFQRSLASEMGSNFRKTNSLYDDFKAAEPISETLDEWTNSIAALWKGITKESNPEINYLFQGIKQSLTKPTSPRMVLSSWENLMSLVPKVTNEEKVILRDAADALYKDMRSILQKKDQTLLDTWDTAYQSWKNSVDVYDSNVLNKIKSSGQIDTIVDNLATGKIQRIEQDAILKAMESNPEPVRELFISSLLRKAKSLPPNEGAKLIRGFLDSWDFKTGEGEVINRFLDPNQAKYLDDLSSYMEENFDYFLLSMKEALGIESDKTAKLAEQKAQLSIGELVDNGDFDSIASNWSKISGKEDFSTALKTLKPEERKVVGLSIFKDVWNENLPFIQMNKDGTVDVSAYVKAFDDSYKVIEKMGGAKKNNKILKDLYSTEQIQTMQEARKMIDTFEDVKKVPAGSIKKIYHGALAFIYSTFGQKYVGAVARHAGEAVAPSPTEFYKAVDSLVEKGLLEKNFKMTVGDVLNLLNLPSGAIGGQAGAEIID